MIFSVQHYLEDYFHRRNYSDPDQYAVKLANLYGLRRAGQKRDEFLKAMHRVQTVFYRRNEKLDRAQIEQHLLKLLDANFQKKSLHADEIAFPGGVKRERSKIQRLPRRSIGSILAAFKHATEARAIDTIWKSRKAGQLRNRSEKVAQAMLSQFVMGVLSNGTGELLRELASGVGFVDVAVRLSSVSHLIEIKILTGTFTGLAQLETYMKTEKRREGWLVVFDARKNNTALPSFVRTAAGLVHLVVIDVNPVVPSRRK